MLAALLVSMGGSAHAQNTSCTTNTAYGRSWITCDIEDFGLALVAAKTQPLAGLRTEPGRIGASSPSGDGKGPPGGAQPNGIADQIAKVAVLRSLLNDKPDVSTSMSPQPSAPPGSYFNWNTALADYATSETVLASYGPISDVLRGKGSPASLTTECNAIGSSEPVAMDRSNDFRMNSALVAAPLRRKTVSEMLDQQSRKQNVAAPLDDHGLTNLHVVLDRLRATELALEPQRRSAIASATNELEAISTGCASADLHEVDLKTAREPDLTGASKALPRSIDSRVESIVSSNAPEDLPALEQLGLASASAPEVESARESLPVSAMLSKTYWSLRASEHRLTTATPHTPQGVEARAVGLDALQRGYLSLGAGDEATARAFIAVAEAMATIVIALDPVTAVGRDFYEFSVGRNLLTGEPLSNIQRGVALASVLTIGILSDVVSARTAFMKLLTAREGQLAATAIRAASAESESLLAELTRYGVKHSPAELVAISRVRGQIVFLETGSSAAGLRHIILEHVRDFQGAGIAQEAIPGAIIKALKEGRVVGVQGLNRPIYEFLYEGNIRRIAISVGDNGFIVGANPVGVDQALESIVR